MKLALIVTLFSSSLLAQTGDRDSHKGPVVLIRGNGNITVTTGGAVIGPIAGASASASKHDQTMEMAQQLLKHCPEITVIVADQQSPPDYALLLNRESVGWFDEGVSQFMLVRGGDHTVLYANKKGTVAKAMKDACSTILDDWKRQRGPDWWTPTQKK